jgi:hypothetical protein
VPTRVVGTTQSRGGQVREEGAVRDAELEVGVRERDVGVDRRRRGVLTRGGKGGDVEGRAEGRDGDERSYPKGGSEFRKRAELRLQKVEAMS